MAMSVRNGAENDWIWQIDGAAARTRSPSLVIASALLYVLGMVVLLAQQSLHLPAVAASFGMGALLAGVAVSVGLAGKVVLAAEPGFLSLN